MSIAVSPPSPSLAFHQPKPIGRTPRVQTDDLTTAPLPEKWAGPLATMRYAAGRGGQVVDVDAFGVDVNDGVTIQSGTNFREAIAVARKMSKWDYIDMPSLGPTAVLRDAKTGVFNLISMFGGSAEDPSQLVEIDRPNGPTKAAWGQYGRPVPTYPVAGADVEISVARRHPDLWAVVGVDRIVNFHPEAL